MSAGDPGREVDQELRAEISATLSSLNGSSYISLTMVALGVVTLAGSVTYSLLRLEPLEKQIDQKQVVLDKLTIQAKNSRTEIEDLKAQTTHLQSAVTELRAESADLVDFLGQVSKPENLGLIHDSLDSASWKSTVDGIGQLAPGRRKRIVLHAILLAWRPLQFNLHGNSLGEGVNSPEFIIRLLRSVGIEVPRGPAEMQSTALRKATQPVEYPLPGDLMFYRGTSGGAVGEYVTVYLGRSDKPKSHGVCIGILDAKHPLQIMDALWLETDAKNQNADIFDGYRRPNYDTGTVVSDNWNQGLQIAFTAS